MSVEHFSRPDAVSIRRSFEWKGRLLYFSDDQWAKITGMVKVPMVVPQVTLMRGSKAYLEVKKVAVELLNKSTH